MHIIILERFQTIFQIKPGTTGKGWHRWSQSGIDEGKRRKWTKIIFVLLYALFAPLLFLLSKAKANIHLPLISVSSHVPNLDLYGRIPGSRDSPTCNRHSVNFSIPLRQTIVWPPRSFLAGSLEHKQHAKQQAVIRDSKHMTKPSETDCTVFFSNGRALQRSWSISPSKTGSAV